MKLVPIAAELLSERIGLSREFFTDGTIARALDIAFAQAAPEDRESMAARLLDEDSDEWQRLVEEVIVPETWFFRHPESFQFLATYVRDQWTQADPTAPFHVLCIPCASGEEAYSVAMTLLAAGLDASRIRIDAADVSPRLLAQARAAEYGGTSFRETRAHFPKEYFIERGQRWHVREDVVRLVHFQHANLLELSPFRPKSPYDSIFCRNVLIYMNARARHKIVGSMGELLNEEAPLFTGPSEMAELCDQGYVPVDHPQSFACRRAKPIRSRIPAPSHAATRAIREDHATTAVPRADTPSAGQSTGPAASAGLANFEQAERLADQGNLDVATSICESLLEQNTADPNIYALLGLINETMDRLEPAEEFFRKALYLAPGHYQSLLHMTLLCERRGDIDGAALYRVRAGRARDEQDRKRVLVEP